MHSVPLLFTVGTMRVAFYVLSDLREPNMQCIELLFVRTCFPCLQLCTCTSTHPAPCRGTLGGNQGGTSSGVLLRLRIT